MKLGIIRPARTPFAFIFVLGLFFGATCSAIAHADERAPVVAGAVRAVANARPHVRADVAHAMYAPMHCAAPVALAQGSGRVSYCAIGDASTRAPRTSRGL